VIFGAPIGGWGMRVPLFTKKKPPRIPDERMGGGRKEKYIYKKRDMIIPFPISPFIVILLPGYYYSFHSSSSQMFYLYISHASFPYDIISVTSFSLLLRLWISCFSLSILVFLFIFIFILIFHLPFLETVFWRMA